MLIGSAVVIAAATAVAFVVMLVPAKRPPNNEPGPYAQKSAQLALDGWRFWQNQEQEQSLENAIESFEEAVELDPENVMRGTGSAGRTSTAATRKPPKRPLKKRSRWMPNSRGA